MKNQYFGDINDYLKYGLLRLITQNSGIRIGICWMLTPNDRRNDGSRITYLSKPKTWRHFDPELYDFLRYCVIDRSVRSIAEIENPKLLPGCLFHSAMLLDDAKSRCQYFEDLKYWMRTCDLLFFDVDNGMEVKSKPYGREGSSKYLYWHEACELYKLGYSLLIFQFHKRMKYPNLVKSLNRQFETNIGVKPLYYRTKHVTLILVSQSRHRTLFEKVNKAVNASWQGQIHIING